MMKNTLIICILAGSNIANTTVLPAMIVRGLSSTIKPCAALVVCKNEAFKISPQERNKTLLQIEKKLNGRHMEWIHHIEILKSALQAAEKERGDIVSQLCWIKAAQVRVCSQPVDEQPKSPDDGKNLNALQQEENSIISKILSIKEITTNLYNPSPNGSFWNSQRCSEARVQYEMKLRELYRSLEEIRAYKKTLKGKE
jgi:hypothetical protein